MQISRKILSNTLAVFGLLLVIATSYGPRLMSGETLSVEVTGIRNTEGTVHVLLYDSAAPFESGSETGITSYATRGAQPGEMTFQFRHMPPGRYAVFVHHDENANNAYDGSESDFEGYGYSRNVGQMTAPAFAAAALSLPDEASPDPIAMIYPQ